MYGLLCFSWCLLGTFSQVLVCESLVRRGHMYRKADSLRKSRSSEQSGYVHLSRET